MKSFSRARIPAITTKQWERASELFVNVGAVVEPAQLRSATGMKASAAWSLLLGVFEERHADLFLLVFHKCTDHYAAKRPYEKGFQPVPWTCPECELRVEDPDELRYDVQAVLRTSVRFV